MLFPLQIEFVRRAEQKLGRQLPQGYVSRMCRENGGEICVSSDDWVLHPILDDSDRTRLKRTCNDVVREAIAARQSAGFPAEALSIATNGCGDHLVLLPDPQSNSFAPSVYAWDHETRDLTLVANEVSELCDAE